MADVKKTTKKVVKKAEVVVKSLDDLKNELVQAAQDLTDSRRSHKQGELVNPHVLTTQRKAIARLKTKIAEELRKESK
jgi:large subunit ribosomal protein L29